jgi:hypothetical protein
MHFTIPRPQKKTLKAQPGGEAASSPACAIGAFIGFHGQYDYVPQPQAA